MPAMEDLKSADTGLYEKVNSFFDEVRASVSDLPDAAKSFYLYSVSAR